MRGDDVIPFPIEALALDIEVLHLLVRDFAIGSILPPIQSAGHGQALGGRGFGNQLNDRFVMPAAVRHANSTR
jgi:hypothetical protein